MQPIELATWAPRCFLGESPRWYDDCWWWIDAETGTVYRHEPGAAEMARPWLTLGTRISLVHPAEPIGMLIAAAPELAIYRDASGRGELLQQFARLDLPPTWACNDGTGAPGGGLYIGAVAPGRTPEGYLQRFHANGAPGGKTPGIQLSNGLAVDPSRTVLYHADSFGRRINSYRLDDCGEIIETNVLVQFDETDGLPDGIATDQDGFLWVAVYGVGQVRRYSPTGSVDQTLTVPTPQVTSVALGGSDGRDLLITTAREGYDETRSAAEPLAGRLFVGRAPVAGEAVIPAIYTPRKSDVP